MTHLFASLRRLAFGIAPKETSFSYRGFYPGDAMVRHRLERVGRTFVYGYHAALDDSTPESLGRRLNAVEAEYRGFAFEGAAMGLAILDGVAPWRCRVQAFVMGPGAAHHYMVYVGVGWALARLHRSVPRTIQRYDPLLRWLILDGYGFHEGYFSWQRSVQQHQIPGGLTGYMRRAFDQGLGRSLWFVKCADVAHIATTIARFEPSRYQDLWSGVGLACAYSGGVSRATLGVLAGAAGDCRPQLAQGAAFAAKARQRAGNPATHTDDACEIFCGMSADEAAQITDIALEELPPDTDVPAYEIWRQRIQSAFLEERVAR
ncbi:MAG TPA: DUF1702 family protein [Herpetosiphonaceae bacterium]